MKLFNVITAVIGGLFFSVVVFSFAVAAGAGGLYVAEVIPEFPALNTIAGIAFTLLLGYSILVVIVKEGTKQALEQHRKVVNDEILKSITKNENK